MVRDITIGQYYNTESVIHKLDPRVKVLFTLVYVISLFFSRNPVSYLVAFVILLLYIVVSHVPFQFIGRGLKTLTILILFTVVMNLFAVKGTTVLFKWKWLCITKEGLSSAIYLGLRLIFMIIGSSMMTYTTTPNALTDGLEKMLSWMKKFHVPVHEFAMIMSLALRFVPILIEELNKIMKAQMARGVDFNEGNLFARIKKLMPIMIPLFVSAVRRSNELAMAMDARCYHGGDGRTKMKPLVYQRRDYIAYGVIFLYLASMIVLAVYF